MGDPNSAANRCLRDIGVRLGGGPLRLLAVAGLIGSTLILAAAPAAPRAGAATVRTADTTARQSVRAPIAGRPFHPPGAIAPKHVFTVNSTADAHNTAGSNAAHVCKDLAGRCTLRAAIEAANANPGRVDKIVAPEGTITLSLGALEPTSSVLIVGAGASHTTISGANTYEIFELNAGTHPIAVEIDGVTLTEGKSPEGGAIYLSGFGTLTLGFDVFSHNRATEGGAVAQQSSDSSLWMSNSVVTANSASSEGGGLYLAGGAAQLSNDIIGGKKASSGNRAVAYGGGVYNENGVVSMINTNVNWNSLSDPIDLGNGGGIDNENVLSMQAGTVSHNSISTPDGGFGGGLYNDDVGQYEGVVFAGNSISASSGSDGGGVLNHGSAKFVNCDADNNSIKDFGTGFSDKGGGLYNSGHLLWTGGSISGNTIRPIDSSAGLVGNGGGVYGYATLSAVDTTITGAKIERNSITGRTPLSTNVNDYAASGGAVYGGSSLSLSHDALEANSASDYYVYGGAIYFASSTLLSASNLDIGHTIVRAPHEVEGGEIYAAGSVALTNSTLRNNSVTVTGSDGGVIGGVYVVGSAQWSNVTVTNTTNTASGPGGYIEDGVANFEEGANLDDTKVLDTTDTAGAGGAIEGGVLYMGENSTFVNFEIDNVTAAVGADGELLGGALFVGAPAAIDQATIANVVSKAAPGSGSYVEGSAVFVDQNAIFNLTNVTLTANRAVSSGSGKNGARGGAIYTDSPLTLLNDTLNDNWATRSGGAVYSDGFPVSFKNTIVNSNPSPSGSCGGVSGGPWFVSAGHNLGTSATCELTDIGDLESNPKLGKLQANGGFILTESELIGSKSIDAGTDSGCPAVDARGKKRPQGKSCDIGAFEIQPPTK